eukprot:438794-Rhodomonas_salina.1
MQVLIEQEITGPALLLMTEEKLIKYGLKAGPAILIMDLVKEANGTRRASAVDTMSFLHFASFTAARARL